MKSIFYYYILLCLTTIIFSVCFYTYETQIDGIYINKPITFYSDPLNLETDKPIYHRGEDVYIRVSYCRNRIYSANTQWKLINETVVLYPTMTNLLPVQCVKNKLYKTGIIPTTAFLGVHHIEGISEVQINPFNTIFVQLRSVDFNVIK